MQETILIVDDDPIQLRLLSGQLDKMGYRVETAETGDEALETIRTAAKPADLIILDLVMPGLDGMGVLERLSQLGIRTPVIVQTANGGIDTVVSAMRAGASDFIVKPVGPERLQVSVRNALRTGALAEELSRARKRVDGLLSVADILTASPVMKRTLTLVERAASSHIPVLIEGESGVGKELVARAIQGSGNRRAKSFVTVNCGAIPENLVESTLFGHEKGAFTGATERRQGKFVEAHGGTLFLDEIGELPLDAQVKLLRALQEGEVDTVGGKKPTRVDFRLISATNRSLVDQVQEQSFREDLYYRLSVFPIRIPPLRERREDIGLLARHFAARLSAEEGKQIAGISADAIQLLESFDWPGNVRQLENAIFRAVVLSDGGTLTRAEFPQIEMQLVRRGDSAPTPAAVRVDTPPAAPSRDQEAAVIGQAEPVLADVSPTSAIPVAPSGIQTPLTVVPTDPLAAFSELDTAEHDTDITAFSDSGELRTLADIEADMIRLALEHCRGKMTEVARTLGIGRSTLYRKLREIGLDAAE
ncbi:MAG: sigma-54 dependent transcriptional regulator [Pseudomonadota bacterium]